MGQGNGMERRMRPLWHAAVPAGLSYAAKMASRALDPAAGECKRRSRPESFLPYSAVPAYSFLNFHGDTVDDSETG